jgi:ElaA protein
MQTIIKTYNELTVDELYEILKLRSIVFVVEQNCVYQDIDDIDKRSYHIYMKEKDKPEIKVYLRVFEKDKDTAQIGRVVTEKDSRRKGYASQLIEKGIEISKNEMKKTKVYLEGQVYAAKLYEKLGFKIISDEFLEDGIPHYKMLKILNNEE